MIEGGIPSELPEGWVRVRLDEVAEVRLGRQRSPKNHSGTQMRPYLRAANVGWNGLKLDDVKEMNFTDDEVAIYRLKKGDIVLSEASGSASEVGKPAIWNDEISDCCLQNTLIRVRSYGVDPHYLLYFLRSEAIRGAFVEHSRGVGIHHIGSARLAAWQVPVPPVEEQRRIVAAIEEQLSRLEAGDRSVADALRKTAQYSVLVAQKLLQLEQPASSWPIVRIGDIAKVGSGSTPLRSRQEYYEGGDIPWVTSSLVNESYVDGVSQYITKKALEETSLRLLPPGTLLVAMYGEGKTRGKCTELRIWATTNQACASIALKPEFESRRPWVKAALQAKYEENRKLSSGGVQKNLNLSVIRAIEIPIPPLDEQDRILCELDEQSRAALRLQDEAKLVMQRSATLRHALLTQAFAGRLVRQGPADEPADALLARIRTEREAAGAASSGRRSPRRAPVQRKRTPDTADVNDTPPPLLSDGLALATATQPTLDLEIPS
ncbi:restriction endonuclease subunit S [Streptomyces sp. NBC_01171]|uniref:restriction endonuclease subunit S n=1 Tax=Streptomyces sp. NBC_01171 TaxID=2903757 RepID=UPI003863DE95|nr:restriction endonuclease subunit S [Streptomyces sp. NBC_01171]